MRSQQVYNSSQIHLDVRNGAYYVLLYNRVYSYVWKTCLEHVIYTTLFLHLNFAQKMYDIYNDILAFSLIDSDQNHIFAFRFERPELCKFFAHDFRDTRSAAIH